MRLTPTIVFLTCLLLTGPSAMAEQEGGSSVALMALRAAPRHQQALQAVVGLLEQTLEDQGATVPSAEALRQQRDSATHEGDLEQIALLRQQARQEFLDFRFAESAVTLERARAILSGRLADLLEDTELRDISLDLARLQLNMGQADLARQTLLELARRDPTIEPSESDYPPQLLEAWRAVVALTDEADHEVSTAEPARLALAARTVGVVRVVSGVLVASEDGSALELRLVVVEAATGEVRRPNAVPLGDQEGWGEALLSAARTILQVREFHYTPTPPATQLFILSSPPGADIALDGLATGEQTPASVEVEAGPHHLRLTLEGFSPTELSLAAWEHQTRPVEVTMRHRRHSAVLRSWWLWTIVGVVVSGAVVGFTVWGVQTREDRPDATISVSRPQLRLWQP